MNPHFPGKWVLGDGGIQETGREKEKAIFFQRLGEFCGTAQKPWTLESHKENSPDNNTGPEANRFTISHFIDLLTANYGTEG